MAEYVKIELGRTSNEYEFHIVCRETRREVENARLREENDSLKLQVTQLRLSNERPETCPVCHNRAIHQEMTELQCDHNHDFNALNTSMARI
jgi:hypothetical protein